MNASTVCLRLTYALFVGLFLPLAICENGLLKCFFAKDDDLSDWPRKKMFEKDYLSEWLEFFS